MLHRMTFLSLLVATSAGCLHFEHPTPDIRPEEWLPCDNLPLESKSSVYVFVFDSYDPFEYCHTKAIREYLISVGFIKVFYGLDGHRSYFLEKMRLIRERCGTARFAVIGYDSGAEAARKFCVQAGECGIPVDLLMSLEPSQCHGSTDGLAFRTVSLFGNTCGTECGPVSGDEMVSLNQVSKAAVPTHPETLEAIVRELTLIGMTIPAIPPREYPDEGLIKPLPAPRETKAQPKPLPAAWDFLKPKPVPPVIQDPLPVIPREVLPTPSESGKSKVD